jgi:hypothetical protein
LYISNSYGKKESVERGKGAVVDEFGIITNDKIERRKSMFAATQRYDMWILDVITDELAHRYVDRTTRKG